MPTAYGSFSLNTQIFGAGAGSQVANAFGLRFPEANLAGHPSLEAYTNVSPTLSITASSTNADDCFKKTAGNVPENSSLIAVATVEYAPTPNSVPAGWAAGADFGNSPAYPSSGVNHARRIYGQDSSLQLLPDAHALTVATDVIPFNLALRTGPNTPNGENAMDHYWVTRYIYTGAVDPRVVFLGNQGGTDAVPVWKALAGEDSALASAQTPGPDPVRKIQYGNTGTNPASPVLTRPTSGNGYSPAIFAAQA